MIPNLQEIPRKHSAIFNWFFHDGALGSSTELILHRGLLQILWRYHPAKSAHTVQMVWKCVHIRMKCISSGNPNLEVCPGSSIRGLWGGGLKSELIMTSPSWLLQNCPVQPLQEHTNANTNVCKVDLLPLITCSQSYSFCTDISNYMNYSKLENYNCL